MRTAQLTPTAKAMLVVLGLTLVAAVVQGWTTVLPAAAAVLFGGWQLFGRARRLMRTDGLSPRWTLAVVATFAIALVAAGHGVAPIGLLLIFGLEKFLVPVVLGWLGIAALVLSAVLHSERAPVLALLGSLLALAAWALFQGASDEPLAGMLGSLPFLVCLGIYSAHLWRLRPPARATSA